MNAIKELFAGRPVSVTIASVLVLCITAWNGIRAMVAIMNWDVLSRFNGNPAYAAVTGLVWFIGGLAWFISLSNRKQLALRIGLILSMIYMTWYWVDRLAVQVSPATNIVFSAIVSILLFSIFNTALLWPSSRVFLKRRQDD